MGQSSMKMMGKSNLNIKSNSITFNENKESIGYVIILILMHS